jgi:hypothetical protein
MSVAAPKKYASAANIGAGVRAYNFKKGCHEFIDRDAESTGGVLDLIVMACATGVSRRTLNSHPNAHSSCCRCPLNVR